MKPKLQIPDIIISSEKLFGLTIPFPVHGFSQPSLYTPAIDPHYLFDYRTSLAILSGFEFNKRVMVSGLHGTGKSTHIEQIAARLNWPCLRVNLDGHLSRTDLIGRDVIKIDQNLQVIEFQDGIIPFALKQPIALILDEYDAGRPDVMFVLQRLLEAEGKFTLIDQNKVIIAHPSFRIFATANTIGLGDGLGIYHGTNALNHGQLDRWNIMVSLTYLSEEKETQVILAKFPQYNNESGQEIIKKMVKISGLIRIGFNLGDISCLMSPRAVLQWAENNLIFHDLALSFAYSFLNKCELSEHEIIAEYYQRVFDQELVIRNHALCD